MDYLTRDGAEAMAIDIRLYWMERGFDVSTSVVAQSLNPEKEGVENIYVVRSDMVDGLPVRRVERMAA